MALDPVMLAILKGRLEQIADEMDVTLFRSAFNPIIAEAHDASLSCLATLAQIT